MKHPQFSFVDNAPKTVRARNNITTVQQAQQAAAHSTGEAHFMTWYRFPPQYQEHAKNNPRKRGSVSGYQGPAYSDFLPHDIDDAKDLGASLAEARRLVTTLRSDLELPTEDLQIFFSGSKGFHILTPMDRIASVEPSATLPRVLKQMAHEIAAAASVKIDRSIYDINRLLRLPNTRHEKSGLFKVQLTADELFSLKPDEIRFLAKQPRCSVVQENRGPLREPLPKLEELFGRLLEGAQPSSPRSAPEIPPATQGSSPSPHTAAIAEALSPAYQDGQRHGVGLAFAAFAAGYGLSAKNVECVLLRLAHTADQPSSRKCALHVRSHCQSSGCRRCRDA